MTKVNFYFFTNILNEIIVNNIIKFKNISIIYRPEEDESKNFIEILKIKNFCNKNKIPFYISNNYKLANKFNANGIFLSSSNKNLIGLIQKKRNFHVIGAAHNNTEYSLKIKQGCEEIMLSPIFFNKKYSINKILGINRFNLITKNWKTKLCALGGINLNNLKKLKMCKISSIAFISLMDSPKIKKPICL